MDREDVHHKLCKKVAQLTKVIYHLNTRNEESEVHLAAVTDAYEREVEHILRTANEKVRNIAKASEATQSGKISKQIEALRSSFEDEKREALREVQNVKDTMSARENKNTTMWSERVSKMSSQVSALKEASAQQAEQFKVALEKADARHAAYVAELVKQHQADVEKLTGDHATQIQLKAQEREAAEVELRRSFDEQLASQSRRLGEEENLRHALEAELLEARERLRKQEESLAGGDDALRNAQEARDRLASELDRTRSDLERTQSDLVEARRISAEGVEALKSRESEIASLLVAVKEGEEMQRSLQTELSRLRQQLCRSEEQLNSARAAQDDLMRDNSATSASAAAERRKLEDELRELKTRVEVLLAQVASKEASEAKLLAAEAAAQERLRSLEAEVTTLRRELEGLRRNARTAADSHEEALRLKEEELRKSEAALDAERSETRRLQSQLEEQVAEMRRRLADSGNSAAEELEAERARHAEALESMKRQHAHELVEWQETHASELREVRDSLEAQLEALRRQMSMQEQDGAGQIQAQALQIEHLQEELRSRDVRLGEAQEKTHHDLQQITKLEEQVARLQCEGTAQHDEFERLRKDHAEALERLRQRLEDDATKSSEQHRRELEALRRQMAEALIAKEREGEVACQRLQEDLKRAGETHQREMDELRRRLEALSGSSECEKANALAELNRVKAEMQRKLDEAETEGVQMVQRLSSEHQAKLTEVFEKQSLELTNLREKLGQSHQERIDEMRQKWEREREELKASHEAKLRDTAVTHETSMEQARRQHEAKVESLEDAAKKDAERHAAQMSQAEIALQKERDQLAEVQKTTHRLEESLREAQAVITSLNGKLQALERSHEKALQKKDARLSKEKRSLKEQHKSDVEALLEEHLAVTSELRGQFDRARQLQDMQIDMLQKRSQELQELYDNRPSREEDIELMAKLRADLEEKEAALKKMQFYKLELVNRENNFNKVFGSAPQVGIMNPVATAKRGTGPAAPPPVRLVQPPGGGMQGLPQGLPPLAAGPGRR